MSLLNKFLNRKLSRDDFAALVIRRMSECGVHNLDYSSANFSLRRRETSHTMFLYNAYQKYCDADRKEKENLLSLYIKSFASSSEIPEDFDQAKRHLMPIVRDYRYTSLSSLTADANGSAHPGPLAELSFADELTIGLAFDSESSIQFLKRDRVSEWNVTLESALGIAIENLRDKTDPGGFKKIRDGVYCGEWGDSYDAARMVLPDCFHRLDLNGTPVVFAPNRNILLICGAYDKAGIEFILKHGDEAHFKEGYPLTPNLYILNDQKWNLFLPEESAIRNLLVSIQKRREAIDYGEQKRCLDAIYGRDKIDIFVANCNVYERKDGGFFTHSVWSNGANSDLPKTDVVALFVNPGQKEDVPKDVLIVPWETLKEAVGALLEPVGDLLPPRYRVREFPDSVAIEALRPISTTL
jgi:hypothetical protein